ncbi:MAG TPA: SWIM zinc finger family protein [Candidatus Nanoarchaeia archaeon]|nr:SWIM zinc finger family protein [Candidatus Nanoarchaeia archaeon]
MKVARLGDRFKIESSDKENLYNVDLAEPSCDCPSFIYRRNECKHIIAAKKFAEEEARTEKDVLEFVSGNDADIALLHKKFGNEKINQMIRLGDLIERDGKVRVLAKEL